MKVHVLHDAAGNILSAAVVHAEARLHLAAPPGSFMVVVDSELTLERLGELHEHYRVDVEEKVLRRR